MILITNNLPSGYHRDFQLIKENSIYAVENIKEILDIFIHSIALIRVKDIDLDDDKYKYLFTVDSINDLVMQGKSFREAYKEIGEKVQAGTYQPSESKNIHIWEVKIIYHCQKLPIRRKMQRNRSIFNRKIIK